MRKIIAVFLSVLFLGGTVFGQSNDPETETVEALEKQLASIPENDYSKRLVVMGKLMTLYGKNEADAGKALPLFEESIGILERFFEPNSEVLVSMYKSAIQVFATSQDNKKLLYYFEKYVNATGSDELDDGDADSAIRLYSSLGMAYYEVGKYGAAIKCFEKSAIISERVGADELIAVNYSNIGLCYSSQSEYEKAIEYNTKALEIYKKLFGEGSSKTINCFVSLGNVCLAKADYKEALSFYEKALALERESASDDNRVVAVLYNNIGLVYSDTAEYDKALSYLNKALHIRKKLFGEDHMETADSYANIGKNFMAKGDYDGAIENLLKSLEIRKKLFPEHPDTAGAYQNLGLCYNEKDDYDKALYYYEMALKMDVAFFGQKHQAVAIIYSNISKTYHSKDDFKNAILYCDKAILIRTELFGEVHPDVAASYMNKGLIYRSFGDYDNAALYIEKALQIYIKVFGEKHNLIATCYNNLGVVFEDKELLDKALTCFKKALAMRLELFGENNVDVSVSYLSIGNVYLQKGDYENALSYYEQARALNTRLLGEKHSNTALAYNNIGNVYQKKENFEGAIERYKKVLEIFLSIYGENHSNVAMEYENLGCACNGANEYDQAIYYHNKAKDIRERLFGKNHPDTANSYNNLAVVYAAKKDYDSAILYAKKALANYESAFGENHFSTATLCFNIGLYYNLKNEQKLSSVYWKKCVRASKDLSRYVNTINDMKRIAEMTKDDEVAQLALQEGISTVERARLDLSSIKTNLLRLSLPLYYRGVFFEASRGNPEKSFEYSEALRNRGFLEQLGFETALKLNGVTEEERNLVREYSERITHARKEIEIQNGLGERRNNEKLVSAGKELAETERLLLELDLSIGKRVPAYSQLRNPQPTTALEAKKWCKKDMAILEYVIGEKESCCLVIKSGLISIVELDANYDYTKAALELRSAVYKKRQNLASGKRTAIQKYRAELYSKLIEPAVSCLGNDVKRLLIVPDASLSSIPFDILGNEDVGVLCDSYAISFSPSVSVSMMRDQAKDGSFSLLGIGNALYDSKEVSFLAANTPVGQYYANNLPKWENLPGTGMELQNIKNKVFVKEKVDLYEQKKSTEAFVKELSLSGNLSAYSQLLFACHGYFSSDMPEYSALVFSEVSGAIENSTEDGYLTVAEIAILNMNAAFINLSACQTGLSYLNQGDGMVGLTRSCIVAGADRVGVTLWEVDDSATCAFQEYLYSCIKDGSAYSDAYRNAKQNMKASEEWSDPIYWAAFVLYE